MSEIALEKTISTSFKKNTVVILKITKSYKLKISKILKRDIL